MKLENQVCALDQAKKLKELGVEQKSLWHYTVNDSGEVKAMTVLNTHQVFINPNNGAHYSTWKKIAAYTSAELGEMLPRECFIMLEPGEKMHVWHAGSEDFEILCPADTEAQAKADLLIWLLEKGHTTAAEVNERLAAA